MKIRPLFKWFGSKWQSAKRYPAPLYPTIFEPFAGSAGYSLNYVEKNVRIDEINPNLISLWMWLIHDATQSDILAIPIDYPVGYNIKESGLSGGQQLLLKHWQRTNNYGECWTVSPWGNKPGQWTANTRSRVAEEFQAVKHWKLGPIAWDEDGTYFVDPPYQFNYTYGCKNFDHRGLANSIRKLLFDTHSHVIACEAACPKTGKVPTYLNFKRNHRSVTSRRATHGHHHSDECICELKS